MASLTPLLVTLPLCLLPTQEEGTRRRPEFSGPRRLLRDAVYFVRQYFVERIADDPSTNATDFPRLANSRYGE